MAALRIYDDLPIYHYLFPHLHGGACVVHHVLEMEGASHWRRAVRQGRAVLSNNFGLNFAVSVVTGIPMEFQFGTN